MTLTEMYEKLTIQQKNNVEEIEMNIEFAEQYLDTLVLIMQDKEMVVRNLVERYAEHYHIKKKVANENLKKEGFTDDEIFLLRSAYYDKYNN